MLVAWNSRVIAFALLAVIGAVPCFSAEPGKRIALVIGNSAYKHTNPLVNPVNDAEDMAKALSTLGFQVSKGVDLNKTDMDRTVSNFASALKGAEVGLFFYAGHGMQVSGQNYLVPVDAKLESNSALDFEAVRLDVVQRVMENETLTNVLILDACRDNPLTRNLARALGTRSNTIGKGLAPQESGAGTIISYSTQPGNVALDGLGGRNSPFAGALVKHLPTEGKDLASILVKVRNDVMTATAKRQVPWEHSALTGELILASPALKAALQTSRQGTETGSTSKAEEVTKASEQKTAAKSEPSVAPERAPNNIFVDSFDGDALSSHWEIKNDDQEGYIIENGTLHLISSRKPEEGPWIVNSPNVFQLKNVNIDGDWDISLPIRLNLAGGIGGFQVGLLDDKQPSVRVAFFVDKCDADSKHADDFSAVLAIVKSGKQEARANAVIWRTKSCSGDLSKEEFSDRLSHLKDKGGVFTLSKRGRNYSTKFEAAILAQPAIVGPITIPQALGQPAFALRHLNSYGQSSAYIDEFRITRVKQAEATAQ